MTATLQKKADSLLAQLEPAERVKIATVQIGFYDPAERAREKSRQRREDTRDVREGRLVEVEQRNHRLPGARPVTAWETTPPME